MKYLKVHVEGCHIACDADLYAPLDPLTEYREEDLLDIAQEMVNERHSWGTQVVDEDEVPERER